MADWAGIIDNIILTIGFCLMVGSMILPLVYKNMLAMLVNWFMSPLTSNLPFSVVLLIAAVVISAVSTLVQKYKVDQRLMRRLSEKSAALNKELREAQLSNNKNKLKKLQEEQLSLMEDQSRVSMQTLKSSAYTMLVSIPMFLWAYWYLGNQSTPLTWSLPLVGTHAFTELFVIVPYWCIWLAICSIAAGYVMRKVVMPQKIG